jgi:ATP-dependent 26S proteasome regulatory subunit
MTCCIGYFTADAIEAKWSSLGIVRDRNSRFYSIEFYPDTQVFCESSTIRSPYELPPIDLIKSRRYAELQDGTFISPVDEKEIAPCALLTATFIDAKFDYPDWQFIERELSGFLRSHKLVLVNGAILNTTLITGRAVQIRVNTTLKQPQLFAVSATTRINYIHSQNAQNVRDYPSFCESAKKLERLISISLKSEPNLHPKGCVISGAQGSGRGFLARHISDKLKLGLLEIDGGLFDSTMIVFPQLTVKIQPKSIVILHNFDQSLTSNGAFQRRIVSQLLSLIDRSQQVFFVMTVLSKEPIPGALQTASRLGFSIAVPPLSSADLHFILSPQFDQSVIDSAIGLPVSKLVNAIDRNDIYEAITYDTARSIHGSVAHTEWSDIGGLSETKRIVNEAIVWPLTRAKELKALGVKPPRGILLYGPPGCGKTMIARAIATSLSSSFFSISAAAIFQMYLGESERIVRELFALAREKAPAVIFVDEIDAIVGKRGKVTGVSERVLSTFLNEMDGVTVLSDVVVVGATNRKDALDDALCRPGRFDCLIELNPPQTLEDRREILGICTRKMPLGPGAIEEMATIIPDGASGAEIDNFCREAALCALNDGAHEVTADHMRRIIRPQH